MQTPPPVRAFRDQDRAGRRRSSCAAGWAHFAFTSGASLAVIAAALLLLDDVRPLEWLLVPATLLFANFVEYRVHRGPMHRRDARLAVLYERHTLRHHRFFTHEAMNCDSPADFALVLFPPVMILVVLGGVALPIALLLFAFATPNLGWLFVASAMSYFLAYEWMHFAYHLPRGTWIAKTRLLGALRRHHAAHHDMRRMAHANFNVTFPICDWLFGTLVKEEPGRI